MRNQVPFIQPDLRQSKERLALLAQVAGQLISSTDRTQLVSCLFELIATELRLDAFLSYASTGDGALELVAYAGLPEADAEGAGRLGPAAALCVEAIRRQAPEHITAIQASQDMSAAFLKGIGLDAFVCLPLMASKRPVGALGFGRRQADHFSAEDIDFLRTLSVYVALALERLRGDEALRASEAQLQESKARLAESEERLRLGMQVAGFGTGDQDIATGKIFLSPELGAIFGLPPDRPITIDRLAQLIHPDDRARVLAAIKAFEDPKGTGKYIIEHRIVRPDGEVRWVQARGRAFFKGEGEARRAVRTIAAVQDITERKRAELALAESEERLRLAAGLAGFGTLDWDLVKDEQVWYPELRAIFGFAQDEPAKPGKLANYIFPEDRERVAAALAESLSPDGSGLFAQEYRIARADGAIRWVYGYGHSFFEGQGAARRAVRMIAAVQDITDRKQVELALAENEERLQLAQALGGIGSFDWDIRSGVVTLSPSCTAVTGVPAESVQTVEAFFQLVHPDDVDSVRGAIDAALAGRKAYAVEYRIIRPTDRQLRWLRVQGGVVRDQGGKALRMLGVVLDVTERKQAQEREQLLMREVDHRGKNLLAVIQSVVRMTQAASVDELIAAILGRIQALARAHTLLAASRWEGAELMTLVREELAPFGPVGERTQISGPIVQLKPAAAQSLALVLHELAINAVKYGALSRPEGHVGVTWSVDDASGDLALRWTERGGPPVTPPIRTGFGSTAIKAGVEHQLRGKVRMDWQPEGLECELTLPARQFIRRADGRDTTPPPHATASLQGVARSARVLVVEDEALIALNLARILEQMGHSVVGPAATIDEAFDLLSGQDIDIALLDIDLGGSRSFAVADALSQRDVPFAFLTGFTRAVLPSRFQHAPMLEKPEEATKLSRLIKQLLDSRASAPT